MGLIKPREQNAWEIRHLSLHGSTARRGMAKWGGQIQRRDEKPGSPGNPGRKK